MGVLDELKQEAEKAQAKREGAQGGKSVESADSVPSPDLERRILTRIDDLYTYFNELQKQLIVIDPQVVEDVQVQDLCKLTNLKQGDYKISVDNENDVRKFNFHYTCTSNGVREVKFPNRVTAESKREFLWSCSLKFKFKDLQGERCAIVLEAYLPVSFEFEADLEKAVIRLRVKNKPMLGVSHYSYSADQINQEFMDEVAKYILHKPNRFDELSGNTIPEDTVLRLRAQLEEKKVKKSGLKAILTKPLFGKKS